MEFKVDDKMIEPIVRDQIAAAVVAQLGDAGELVRRAVRMALGVKVDEQGNVSNYGRKDFLEQAAESAIRDAARAALRKVIEDQAALIEAAVEDELRKRPKRTAAAIVAAFRDNVNSNYSLTANFTINRGPQDD